MAVMLEFTGCFNQQIRAFSWVRTISVTSWIFQETNSETEFSVQYIYLGLNPHGKERGELALGREGSPAAMQVGQAQAASLPQPQETAAVALHRASLWSVLI